MSRDVRVQPRPNDHLEHEPFYAQSFASYFTASHTYF